MPIGKINPEFLVNSTTGGDQNEGSVTALADGRFVVTYTDNSALVGDTSLSAIRGRIFNADGSEAVPEFLVNSTFTSAQSESSVTALSDGRFVVTFRDFSALAGDTSGAAVRARIFNADGSQAVPEFLVNSTVANGQFDGNVTALADGRFVVTFTDASVSGGDTSGAAVRARIFNADGSPFASEFLVNSSTANAQNQSSVTTLADGRFVVTFTDGSNVGGDLSGNGVKARIFNADGTQSVAEFLVNTTTTNPQSETSVAALADGRFVVTYTDNSVSGGDTSNAAVRARIFNANGTESVPEFLVNTTVSGNQNQSSVVGLADGRFVVVYTDNSASGGDTGGVALRAKVFNSDGSQSIPEFLVNTTTTNDQFDSSVAALPDGRFVVTFTDTSATGGDATGAAVRSQVFDPTVYDGTSAAETVNGGSLADRFFGYGGDDVISGRGGDDFINGGEGADTLNGDDGNDRLDGGAGSDSLFGGNGNDELWGRADVDQMFGGAGVDSLRGGLGDDTLFGDAGADNLYGGLGADLHNGGTSGTDIDYARYDDANYGNLVINLANAALNTGAAAGDTYIGIEGLVGGLGSDRITGDSSANRLWGFGGADSIFGGLGNDTLYGGSGVDRFYFNTAPNASTNSDTIADFSVVDDFLMLDDAVFAGIGPTGFLASTRFASVAAGGNATTVDHRIVYEQSSGKVFFDADGSGTGVKVQFATVTAGVALTAADLFVF